MEKFINIMVNEFVDEDIKEPACLKANKCAKYLKLAYNKKREERFNEILREVKRVNRLKF